MRGPQIMKGYYNNEAATKDMITEDGWLKTGDIGYADDDSYFYIVDRYVPVYITPFWHQLTAVACCVPAQGQGADQVQGSASGTGRTRGGPPLAPRRR